MHHVNFQKLLWLATARSAAFYAAFILVVIQVGIGIIMKASQGPTGEYAFSVSASLTFSELIKFALSIFLFYRQCTKRRMDSQSSAPCPVSSSEMKPFLDHAATFEGTSLSAGEEAQEDDAQPPTVQLDWRSFWTHYCVNEISVEMRYGFAQLALLYALINNTIFVAYRLADPGTIMLTRSGVTFITALVMIATLGTKISRTQWLAIVIQISALVVTQYKPDTGTSWYPLTTYLILFLQIFLTAVSGVYNQALLKTENVSLHASNAVLYASGVIINFTLYIVISQLNVDEPSFLTGCNSLGAILVVLSNVLIGLAYTAVFKYADAVIRCLASAISTSIILLISPLFFGTDLSFLVLPGTIIIFISSWLYIEAAPPDATDITKDKVRSQFSGDRVLPYFRNDSMIKKKYRIIFLGIAGVLTITIVTFLQVSCTSNTILQPETMEPIVHTNKTIPESTTVLESPFKNIIAFIRWNSVHPERFPLQQKYAPFFHTLHFSMPGYIEDPALGPLYQNLTHDSWSDSYISYLQTARTMQFILDGPPESPEADIDGILHFHFDAWINPMDFEGENFKNIWITEINEKSSPGPVFECMKDSSRYSNWWPIDPNHPEGNRQVASKKATAVLANFNLGYVVDPEEFCTGWSDIYFIPRRFFADWIFLAKLFAGFRVFEQLAIPTINHIIDQSRRDQPTRSILTRTGDCWGSCCHPPADAHDVLFHRCGHRISYTDPNTTVIDTHFGRLDKEASKLGSPLETPDWKFLRDNATSLGMFKPSIAEALAPSEPPSNLPLDSPLNTKKLTPEAPHVDAHGDIITGPSLTEEEVDAAYEEMNQLAAEQIANSGKGAKNDAY